MENLHSPKEGRFAGLDAIPDFRKIAAFEDGLGKPKPLLGGTLSSFAALKCLQHGEVGRYCVVLGPQDGIQEHFCAMLQGETV